MKYLDAIRASLAVIFPRYEIEKRLRAVYLGAKNIRLTMAPFNTKASGILIKTMYHLYLTYIEKVK